MAVAEWDSETGEDWIRHSVAPKNSSDEVAIRPVLPPETAENWRQEWMARTRTIGAFRAGENARIGETICETIIFQRRAGEHVSPTTHHRMTVTQMERRRSQFRKRAPVWSTCCAQA